MHKVGFIGLGRMGKAFLQAHQLLALSYPIQVAYLYNREPLERFRNLQQIYHVPNLTSDYEQILQDPEVKGVIITTTTNTHKDLIIKAADQGKHIFCEKPGGQNLEELQEIKRAVESNEVECIISYNRRFDPPHQKLKQQINSQEFGNFIKFTAEISDQQLPNIDFVKTSGGIFKDFCSHTLDLINFLIPAKPISVYAKGNVFFDQQIGEAGDFDQCEIIVNFDNGGTAFISQTRYHSIGYQWCLSVQGTKKTIILDNQKTDSLIFKGNSEITTAFYKDQNDDPPFVRRFKKSLEVGLGSFYRVILGETVNDLPRIDEAISAMKFAMAAEESTKTGKFIHLQK